MLRAPFAGVVARRYVENFQAVQAREPIVSLQDVGELEVVIHVPERVFRSEPARSLALVEFEGLPDRRFPAEVKSWATDADPQTQTYEVVLALPKPPDIAALPGMAVTVQPDPDGEAGAPGAIRVPLQAVFADAERRPHVWIHDPQTKRAVRRAIEPGRVEDGLVEVTGGLEAGERIVTAGIHHVRDAMLLWPLEP